MPKARYRTTFEDGTTLEGDFTNADEAKRAHRNQRIRDLDPGGTMNPADIRTHATVKVRETRELTDDELAARRAPADEARRDDGGQQSDAQSRADTNNQSGNQPYVG